MVCGNGPRRDVVSQSDGRQGIQQAEGADQTPLSRDDADGTDVQLRCF